MKSAETRTTTASRPLRIRDVIAAVCVALALSGAGRISPAAVAPKSPAHRPTPGEIDALFSALAQTDNDEDAKAIEDKIMAAFLRSGSPTVDLLMTRAAAALQAGDTDTAKKLIASITEIEPDFAEAWHQRGIMQAAAGVGRPVK